MRKIYGIIVLIVCCVGSIVWYMIMLHNARCYMESQIARLKTQGIDGYVIYDYDYIVFDAYAGPCITVKARRNEIGWTVYNDGFHYIEIDYPIFQFMYSPQHRI